MTQQGRTWIPPDPRDLPDLRTAMIAHTLSPQTMAELRDTLDAGRGTLIPMLEQSYGRNPVTLAAILLNQAEARRLTEATLYYATPDMTALAVAAAAVPPREPVRESRVPTECGLMVFGAPIGNYTEDLGQMMAALPFGQTGVTGSACVPIVAVSWESGWTPTAVQVESQTPAWLYQHAPGEWTRLRPEHRGVWLTFYSPAGAWLWDLPAEQPIGRMPDGSTFTAADVRDHSRRTPLTWDNEMIMTFGAPFDPPPPESTQSWAQVLYTAWQLMAQQGRSQLVEVADLPRNRDGRKRDARAGITTSGHVRLVDVHAAHRPSRAAAAADEQASTGRRAPTWTCRWPVGPYRRYTCLRPREHAEGQCEHEDQIVAGSIRGPAGLPLRTSKVVRLWDHQPDDDEP